MTQYQVSVTGSSGSLVKVTVQMHSVSVSKYLQYSLCNHWVTCPFYSIVVFFLSHL